MTNNSRRRTAHEVKVWTECKGDYLPLGAGVVRDVSEGPNGEDRLTFTCEHCGRNHDNAQAVR